VLLPSNKNQNPGADAQIVPEERSLKKHPDYALPSVTKHLIADQEFCVVP
jgi:hypothetical protein